MPDHGVSEADLYEWLHSEATADFLTRVRKKRDMVGEGIVANAALPGTLADGFRIMAGWIQALDWILKEVEHVD